MVRFREHGGELAIEPIFFILLGSAAYVGWNIGANDTANCIGTTVGCGLLSFRRASILVAVFVVLGALLQGRQVMHTIGKGIVLADLDMKAVFVALICSGIFVTLATFFKIPTSTSQAIVGGLVGVGLAIDAKIDYAKFITIAESWLICPLMVMVLAFLLYHLLSLLLGRRLAGNLLLQNTMGWLAILSSCYVAYSLGANHAGVSVGMVANLGIINPTILLIVGGLSIAVGAVTYGKKVTDTVGKGITQLDITGAFVAQIASGFGIHLFSFFGIPISTSSAIVGAVVGVGLVKGARSISQKTIWTILIGWVLTPTSAALASYVIYRLLSLVF